MFRTERMSIAAGMLLAAYLATPAAAQDPNCMFGANDILCQSSRMAKEFEKEMEQPQAPAEITDPYCMWGEDDILCRSRRPTEEARRRGPDDPRSLDWDGAADPCIMIPECDINRQFLIHLDWLEGACERGNRRACGRLERLRASAFTPAPDFSTIEVPRPPGY